MSDLRAAVEALAEEFNRHAQRAWAAHNRACDDDRLNAAETHGAEAEAFDHCRSRLRTVLAAHPPADPAPGTST